MTRTDKPAQRPGNPNFSCGPCAKRPGWTPMSCARRCSAARTARPSGQGAAEARHRQDARAARSCRADYRSPSCPAPTPAPSRWRCGPCSARAASTCCAWEDFGKRWVADIVGELKLAGRAPARGRLRPAARSDRGRFRPRRRLHLERHDSGVRVPNGDWIAADRRGLTLRRRDLGAVRAGDRLGEDRCR